MPAKGAAKRHPPAVQRAIVPAASDHSAVGAAPTSQHCPTAGAKGGLFCGPASTTGWPSATSRVRDRTSDVEGKSCADRVDRGGRSTIHKKNPNYKIKKR